MSLNKMQGEASGVVSQEPTSEVFQSQSHTSSQFQSPRTSYSAMTQRQSSLTKGHAVIIKAIDGISVQEYSLALGKMINPSNITQQSKTFGHVCFYLTNEALVNNLTKNRATIKIRSHNLEIKPFVSKTQKVVLSNVNPVIPDGLLIREINQIGITPTSRIITLKAGMTEPGYEHILSFRRMCYIPIDEVKKLPPSVKIQHEDSTYWIYISISQVTCILCKEEGHIARNCQNVPNGKIQEMIENSIQPHTSLFPKNTSHDSPDSIQSCEINKDAITTNENANDFGEEKDKQREKSAIIEDVDNLNMEEKQIEILSTPGMNSSFSRATPASESPTSGKDSSSPPTLTNTGRKRSCPSSTVSDASGQQHSMSPELPELVVSGPQKRGRIRMSKKMRKLDKKKKKKERNNENKSGNTNRSKSRLPKSITAIKTYIVPAEEHFKINSGKYILNFDQLVMFLEEAFGAEDIQELAAVAYTKDTSQLTHMLKVATELVFEQEMKNFIDKIVVQLGDDSSDNCDSEASEKIDIDEI